MDFARKQLEKYGWKDGQGLGKNEDGISIALKPKLKFDTAGIGHDAAEQFTNNWWERVFNSAANNINVDQQDDTVQLQVQEKDAVEITTKNYSLKELKKNKDLQYGSFLKTAKISDGGIEHYDVKVPESFKQSDALTDEQLFAACGGRTAHKGARHGLNLSGKLARLEKQEKMLMKKMKNFSLSDEQINIEKKMKKVKKHKVGAVNESIQEAEQSSSTSKKKHKKKRKSVTFNEETVVKYYTPDLDTSPDSFSSSKDENSNDSSQDNNNQNGSDEGIEQDMEVAKNEQEDNHKSFEEAQCNFNDLSKAERKKLKKKRKLSKKSGSATNKFIEEVREDSSIIEDKSKKRKFDSNEGILKKKKKGNRDGSTVVMNSIVQSMDHFCKISDDEK